MIETECNPRACALLNVVSVLALLALSTELQGQRERERQRPSKPHSVTTSCAPHAAAHAVPPVGGVLDETCSGFEIPVVLLARDNPSLLSLLVEQLRCFDARVIVWDDASETPTMHAYLDSLAGDARHLIVPFQVAMLTNGSLQLPADTADVYIEIGANSRNLLIDELPLDAFPSAFLLTFEPLMHKWAKIMSRETRADSSQRTGFYHARAMAFPIAIHDSGAVQTFNVAPMDGCSSLLPGNPAFKEEKDGKLVGPPDNNYDPFVAHACLDATEQRQVPTVSLEVVIRDWLRDEHDIAHVKIDAQGYDIQAFKTAGRSMHRIKRALFEVWADRCRPLYVGQLQCRAVLGDMRALGYTVAHGDTDEGFCAAVDVQPNNNCEKDVVFDRAPGPIT